MDKHTKAVIHLSLLTYFLQGFEGLSSQSLFVYLKNVLHLTPAQMMWYGTFIGLAWTIKPIIGFAIDKYWGKRIWYIYALILSLGASLVVAFGSLSLLPLLTVLACLRTSASVRDIAIDGMAVVTGKESGQTSNIQSLQWIAVTLGGLLVGVCGGWIAERYSYHLSFKLLIPIYAFGFYYLFKINNLRTTPQAFNIKQLFKHKKFLYACLFIFLYNYSPSFGTPLSFIVRDQFKWSEIFIGTLGTVCGIISLCGAFTYKKFSKYLQPKKIITWSIFIGAITTLCYLHYTPTTAIVYDVLFSFTGMLFHLVLMTWMAEQSITGLETTSFATLCAISNLAGTCSSMTGAWLYPILGLTPLILLSAGTSLLALLFIKKIFD